MDQAVPRPVNFNSNVRENSTSETVRSELLLRHKRV
jgi:hypothetical protein